MTFLSALAGCAYFTRASREPASGAPDEESALRAFSYLHSVAVAPRCVNCHVTGNRPMQLDGGARRIHSMNIQRRLEKLGQRCTTCHQDRNLDQAHLPPGAPDWRLPGKLKGYEPGITSRGLCRLWLDPSRNGFESGEKNGQPRTPEELLEHVANDPLVNWTWAPGPGRVPSVNTHEEFVRNFALWVAGGTPCP